MELPASAVTEGEADHGGDSSIHGVKLTSHVGQRLPSGVRSASLSDDQEVGEGDAIETVVELREDLYERMEEAGDVEGGRGKAAEAIRFSQRADRRPSAEPAGYFEARQWSARGTAARSSDRPREGAS